VLSNSNGNTTQITLAVGIKTVFSVYPAERAIVVDGSTIQIPNSAVLPLANGGTGSSTAAFSGSNITDLNATAITAGTISNNRTTASSSNGASSIVERDATGNFSTNVITANSYSGSGANLTSLNASSVSSGTLSAANGGTGQTSLTANNVILGNATSAVQFVAPGTSANVLTSNGSTWVSQAAGGGGGSFVFLASATAATSVIDFTGLNTTTYSSFLITFTDVRAGSLGCRLYPGGVLATGNVYGYSGSSVDTGASPSITSFAFGGNTIILDGITATTANLGRSGRLWFYPAGGYSNVMYESTVITATNNMVARTANGYINNASESTGIRIGTSTAGNLSAGNFWIYGIKSS
jgi:hypothetical protein